MRHGGGGAAPEQTIARCRTHTEPHSFAAGKQAAPSSPLQPGSAGRAVVLPPACWTRCGPASRARGSPLPPPPPPTWAGRSPCCPGRQRWPTAAARQTCNTVVRGRGKGGRGRRQGGTGEHWQGPSGRAQGTDPSRSWSRCWLASTARASGAAPVARRCLESTCTHSGRRKVAFQTHGRERHDGLPHAPAPPTSGAVPRRW